MGDKIYGVKGSIDLLFADVAYEFKRDLRDEDELRDALENKLPKYLRALHKVEPKRKHIGIVTDAIRFKAYSPVIEGERVVDLKPIGEELDLEKITPEEAILWLDSFLFQHPKPTAEDINWRFGPGSPTHALCIEKLESMWKRVGSFTDAIMLFRLWSKHMEMAYGSKPDPDAFIHQAYLITLIKLVLYLKLSEKKRIEKDEIEKVLKGDIFKNYGILNLIEKDFFDWLTRYTRIREEVLNLACSLAKELLHYDMTEINEDIFKEIYQTIVSRADRHKIGEYYTPEWLCELILKETLELWWKEHKHAPRILDPACGSGTFLSNAIRLLSKKLEEEGIEPEKIAELIFENVFGIDINPLAVIIARANYILMFKSEFLPRRITIPIFIADSIKLPLEAEIEFEGLKVGLLPITKIKGIECYGVEIDGCRLNFPSRLVLNRILFGRVLSGMEESLEVYRQRAEFKKAAISRLELLVGKEVTSDEFKILTSTLETFIEVVKKGKDSVWPFWLNNVYAPTALRETPFDLIVGNPPWVALRYFEDKDYQDFLKDSVFKYGLLDRKQVELFSNMEMATLFFCKVVDSYLKKDGIIGFVMPRSVLTGSLHHVKFKLFKTPLVGLIRILDLEEVLPLFNVPSCVLMCTKDRETIYPVPAYKYAGALKRKNERLSEANKVFKISKYEYEPPIKKLQVSHYYDKIKRGAEIIPRAFWYIEFDIPPMGWVDVRAPAIKTSSQVEKKDPWTDAEIRENVESSFIYATLSSGDIVRFGHQKTKPVVLPIELQRKYKMLDVEELIDRGFTGMAKWLEKAQKYWESRATEKAKKDCPRVVTWLNYRNKISNQNPKTKYSVLYNATGSNLASYVMTKHILPSFDVGKTKIKPAGFIIGHMICFYDTDDEEEAHYLCAVLNSNTINEAIKPLQTKGLYGERTITRRPFMFSIPQFDRDNPKHMRLAELSKICHAKVSLLDLKGKKPASARREATKLVEGELREIDEIVEKIVPQLS